MLKRSISLLAVLAMASVANAGAVVELRLADLDGNPIMHPSPGFLPGDQFVVELWINPDQEITVREMTIDYRASDPVLLSGFGLDIDTVNQPGMEMPEIIPNFWFDYSGLGPVGSYPADGLQDFAGFMFPTTAGYTDFSNLLSDTAVRNPASTVTPQTSASASLRTFASGVFSRLGGMPITIPMDTPEGTYDVDLLGSPTGAIDDRNNGSSLVFGFGADMTDPVTIWATATGDAGVNGPLGYDSGAGPLGITVVPEPATLALLAIGGLVALRRKRNA